MPHINALDQMVDGTFRTENSHISQIFTFQNAQLKILDQNGEDSQLGIKKGEKYKIQIDLELQDSLVSNCQGKNINYRFSLTTENSLFWIKLDIKNCKISGNFDDIELLIDSTVPATYETLAQKHTVTDNKVSGLDYTAFMINKENQSTFRIVPHPVFTYPSLYKS